MECEKCPIEKECRPIRRLIPCPLIRCAIVGPLEAIADVFEAEGNTEEAEEVRKAIAKYKGS